MLEELGIGQDDLPGKYYIYNKEKEFINYKISEDAIFKILEIPENNESKLLETDLETFTNNLNKNTVFYKIVVRNDEIIEAIEDYLP